MKRLIFVKGWKMYQPGESAGFDDATAQRLIDSGVAADADLIERQRAEAKAKAEADAAQAKADAEAAAAKAKAEADAAQAKADPGKKP